jgi:hypothetical protein
VAVNPTFAGFNQAFVHYCDGSFMTSSNAQPVPVPGTESSLFFRGRNNLRAVLEDLIFSYGLGDGTERVVLTGGSAGGQATYFAADWVRSAVLSRARFPTLAAFASIADAGMFLDAADFNGVHQYRGRLVTALPLWKSLEARTLPSACLDARSDPTDCFYPQWSALYLATPLFVLQSNIDAEQLRDDGQMPCCPLVACSELSPFPDPRGACNATGMAYLDAYQTQLRAAVTTVVGGRAGLGAWSDSCFFHVQSGDDGGWVNRTVNGVSMRDAVGSWWAGISGDIPFEPVQLIDASAFPGGNPSCPFPPPPLTLA